MKELSIEDKAKRYDEAIEIAKEINNEQRAQPFNVMTRVFTELRESEDERIRKHLIKHFGNKSKTDWNGMPVDKIIAWLEKQGEHQHLNDNFPSFDEAQGTIIVEKKGEQKLDTDFSDLRTWKYIVDAVLTEKEGIGQYLDSPFTEEIAKKLQKRFGNIEQKSAWGEEDGEMRMKVLKYLSTRCNVFEYEEVECWLKSLKDRVQSQQKQGWSEDDRETIDYLIDYLESELDSSYTKVDKEEFTKEIELLKSLRPQNTWKPSDEQIDALEDAIADAVSSIQKNMLNSLYSDLKKLSEEQL